MRAPTDSNGLPVEEGGGAISSRRHWCYVVHALQDSFCIVLISRPQDDDFEQSAAPPAIPASAP
jgi:hypothetical protein